jgi:hypothetical protein
MLALLLPADPMGIVSLDECMNMSSEHRQIYMLQTKFINIASIKQPTIF